MYDLPHLSYCIIAPMNMWMCIHGIKTKKQKINPNFNLWKTNKQ